MPVSESKDQWLTVFKPDPYARLRLICLPFAGGGVQFFRRWLTLLPQGIELCAVQLPGRESRIREQPLTDCRQIATTLREMSNRWFDKPYVVFGHSMGGLLAFEWIRQLRQVGLTMPVQLIVSARRAPHMPDTRAPLRNLPQDEFIYQLQCLKGTPQEVMNSQELMELVLPVLRADFTVCETYQYQDQPPLDCDIVAYGGLQDHTVSREEVDAWREHTTGSFTIRMFPGHHFYLQTCQSLFMQFLIRDLITVFDQLSGARQS